MFERHKRKVADLLFGSAQSRKTRSFSKTIFNLNSLDGVKINQNIGIDDTTTFNIDKRVLNFNIEQGVSCRKYCSFIVSVDASLIISENVFFNNFCSVNCLSSITIGANTLLGEGVKIYDHNHSYSYNNDGLLTVAREDFKKSPISIGSNCWIGSNVTILKGVEIGDNVIIGANCLIYKSVPSNSIVKLNQNLSVETII